MHPFDADCLPWLFTFVAVARFAWRLAANKLLYIRQRMR